MSGDFPKENRKLANTHQLLIKRFVRIIFIQCYLAFLLSVKYSVFSFFFLLFLSDFLRLTIPQTCSFSLCDWFFRKTWFFCFCLFHKRAKIPQSWFFLFLNSVKTCFKSQYFFRKTCV